MAGTVLALLLGLPGRAAAQEQPDTTVAPPSDTTVVELPGIKVVGSILPTVGPKIGSGIPARATVVSSEVIDAWEPHLLSEALVSQPGVSLYDDVGSPFKATLVTRGFTASPVVGLPQGVSVFVDGVPVNEPEAARGGFRHM